MLVGVISHVSRVARLGSTSDTSVDTVHSGSEPPHAGQRGGNQPFARTRAQKCVLPSSHWAPHDGQSTIARPSGAGASKSTTRAGSHTRA